MQLIFDMPYPVSNNCYYRHANGRNYLSKAGQDFKDYIKYSYNDIRPVDIDIKLDIIVHIKLTKKGIASRQIIDLDNCMKCVLDSLIGILYIDDKQVKELHVIYGSSKINGGVTVIATNFIRNE